VVLGSSDGDCLESVFAGDAAEVGPEIGKVFGSDGIAAGLGGENAMHEAGDVGVRHGLQSSLWDLLRGGESRVPPVNRWAICGGPYGTLLFLHCFSGPEFYSSFLVLSAVLCFLILVFLVLPASTGLRNSMVVITTNTVRPAPSYSG
jgi:hypothetical protein